MCEVLMEIMESQLRQREKICSIQSAIDALREFGHNDYEISTMIIRKYGLSEEEAEKYLQ